MNSEISLKSEETVNGVCPIMSKPMLLPAPPEMVVTGQQNVAIQMLKVPCPGKDCQLWNDQNKSCSFRCMVASVEKI